MRNPSFTAGHEQIVRAVGEVVVRAELIRVDLVAPVGEHPVEAAPRVLRLDAAVQLRRELELQPRVDARVEDQRRAAETRVLKGGVELVLGDRGEDQQRERDAQVTHREQHGGLVPVPVRKQLAAQRGEGQPMPAPTTACGRSVQATEAVGMNRERRRAGRDQQRARDGARARRAADSGRPPAR